MCIGILRDPVSAINRAKKKNANKTWLILGEACIMLGLSAAIVAGVRGSSQTAIGIAAASVFVVMAVVSIVLGYVLKIIATILGGRGGFYEGLTAISYSLTPVAASLLIAALLSFLPGGIVLSAISLAVGFAMGIGLIYRGVKELFTVDIMTAFVAVSALVIVLFVASSVSSGLSALISLGGIVGV